MGKRPVEAKNSRLKDTQSKGIERAASDEV